MTPAPSAAPDPEPDDRPRCHWATGPWNTPYHDTEWGVPVHDDRTHFEFLVLEGAQAGLSWLTILKNGRATVGSSPTSMRRRWPGFTPKRIDKILLGPGRHPQPGQSRSDRAQRPRLPRYPGRIRLVRRLHLGLRGRRPKVNKWRRIDQVPATSPIGDALSADLRRRSFGFVGPTVCYSHLQAAGLVNDHLVSCFRYREVRSERVMTTRVPNRAITGASFGRARWRNHSSAGPHPSNPARA